VDVVVKRRRETGSEKVELIRRKRSFQSTSTDRF
jgi:hypothetical protein